MTGDELNSALISKGYVRTADGWQAPRARNKEDPGAADPGAKEGSQEGLPAGTELPYPQLQKQQALDHETAQREAVEKADPHYLAGVSGVDGESKPQFRITVHLRVCNRIRRDPSGALETILDVITATRRRLRERLTGNPGDSGEGSARGRRRKDRNRKAVKEYVPF